MSRCFPFPPPGYEKKSAVDDVCVQKKVDDVDVLKKEKHREKKHKKEKKDKDGKDKDKSDGKHRDKKDRKEKSKEKKKDKEREIDKDKASSSQEKQIPALVESCNWDHKYDRKDREWMKDQYITSIEKKQNTPFRGLLGEKPVEASLSNEGDMKFVLDLCNRIQDEEKGYPSQSMERSPFAGLTNHDRMVKNDTGILPIDKEKKEDRRVDVRKMGGQGVSTGQAVSLKNGTGNLLVGKGSKEDTRINVRYMGGQGASIGEPISVQNETGNMPVGKAKKEETRIDVRNMGGQGVGFGSAFSLSKIVPNIGVKEKNQNRGPNITGVLQNKVGEIPRNLEKVSDSRGENQKKEGESRRKEKKSHGKDKERDKEKKKEERAKEKNERKIQIKDRVKNGVVASQNVKLPPLPLDSVKNPVINQNKKLAQLPNGHKNLSLGENVKLPSSVPDDRNLLASDVKLPQLVRNGDRNHIFGRNVSSPPFVADAYRNPAMEVNPKKRKDTETNGFLLETNVVSNKKVRPAPHPSTENGRKSEPYITSILPTPDRKVPSPINLIKANNNEHKVNGRIEVSPFSISLKKPSPPSSSSTTSSSKTKADQIAQVPKVKPPHPDTKYLNVILSVPKIEELCDFEDEDWLLGSKSHVTTSAGPTPSVWDKAVQIESADVCALPYVIPY